MCLISEIIFRLVMIAGLSFVAATYSYCYIAAHRLKTLKVLQIAFSERVHCDHAFRMGSSNSPVTKCCACVVFLAGTISNIVGYHTISTDN